MVHLDKCIQFEISNSALDLRADSAKFASSRLSQPLVNEKVARKTSEKYGNQ